MKLEDLFENEQENALLTALIKAAYERNFGDSISRIDEDKEKIMVYKYLEDTPRAILILDICESLRDLGYEIRKSPAPTQGEGE